MSDTQGPPPANPLEEIPVEELIRLTREFTRRITNQDRQRLALDLRETGHQRTIQISAPVALQQFFSGEIDLDAELSRYFLNAPLLAHARFVPAPGEPVRRQATAMFSCQDDSAMMVVNAPIKNEPDASLEFNIVLSSSLAMRFNLNGLSRTDRLRWLDLMRRENGIAFLWTRDRWEQPYIIFVVREYFARLYAFSPHGLEAAVRMVPDMVKEMLDWLQNLWFPESESAPAADAERRAKTKHTLGAWLRQQTAAPPSEPAPEWPKEAEQPEQPAQDDSSLPPESLEW